jgi:hypothetical protein
VTLLISLVTVSLESTGRGGGVIRTGKALSVKRGLGACSTNRFVKLVEAVP